ncbi:MAG: putative quinol monooxygenase [Verrucomicrobiota bacterium]
MKTVTVVATFVARPGKETELRNALIGLVAPTRKENGCLNYDLHIASDNPARFLFHENWTTKDALDTHLQSPHIQALLPRVDELCAQPPDIVIWDRIA